MNVEIQQAHPLFAAIVTGIKLDRPPDAETVRLVEDAMAQYAVVALRGSQADDAHHLAFSRAFGPLELPPKMGISSVGSPHQRIAPGLYDVSNLDPDGNLLAEGSVRRGYSKGNELFHSDSSFNPLPTKWSLLNAHTVPPEGGNTEFIDMRAVYDALDEETKAEIEGLTAEHSYWHSRRRAGFTDVTPEMEAALPGAVHPLVRTSANGRRSLYVGAHAKRILEMEEAEGRALLDRLYDFAIRAQFIYSHKWQVGDLVIWDNRCTLHRGTAFDDLAHKRDMRRTTINEYGPEISSSDLLEAARA
jgi:alpha-ketoglutarate-dependent 2,4-dichlorophenoxyacetate dioxygenase